MKTMKTHFTIIFLLLLGTMLSAQNELTDYLVLAAENNPGLKAKFNEYQAELERIPQISGLPDPSISFAYFINPVETRVGPQQAKVSVNQMFPWFGTLGARSEAATEMARVKYEAFLEEKSRLYYEVSSTYYNIYFMQKAIRITDENINILNTFKELALIKLEAGLASAVDELRVEMEVADLENQLAYMQDTKDVLEVQFNDLLNVQDTADILIPDTLWEENLLLSKEDIMDSIALNNHTIRQLEHKMRSWQEQETAARRTGAPNISIGLDYIFVGQSDNPTLESSENGKDAFIFPKIGLTIPLYRKKYSAMVNEATFRMEAVQFEQADKKNELSTLFEKAFRDHRDADRRIELYRGQTKLANSSLNILISAYSSDGADFEEVLRMERKLLKYALELDKARADKNASTAFVNYLTGKY